MGRLGGVFLDTLGWKGKANTLGAKKLVVEGQEGVLVLRCLESQGKHGLSSRLCGLLLKAQRAWEDHGSQPRPRGCTVNGFGVQ